MNIMKLRSLIFAAISRIAFRDVIRASRILSRLGSSASAGSGATGLSSRRIYLDSGLLGLGRLLLRLLLGPGRLGPSAEGRSTLDPGMVGLETTALTRLTRVTGDPMSVFMEALITVMATPETATGADDGVETTSSTTPL